MYATMCMPYCHVQPPLVEVIAIKTAAAAAAPSSDQKKNEQNKSQSK